MKKISLGYFTFANVNYSNFKEDAIVINIKT